MKLSHLVTFSPLIASVIQDKHAQTTQIGKHSFMSCVVVVVVVVVVSCWFPQPPLHPTENADLGND